MAVALPLGTSATVLYFLAGMISGWIKEIFKIRDYLCLASPAQAVGVYPPGGVALHASLSVFSVRLYPWLEVFTGVLIAGLAAFLFLRAWVGEDADAAHSIRQPHSHRFTSFGARRRLPLISSAFLFIFGVGVAARVFLITRSGWQSGLGGELTSFLAIILLGLLLGIRHSTDADHVVAVAAIVSRQRSIRQAAAIGMLWGLGHTLTIFVVGAAIILFGVVIPPRLALALELLVALMLILLGALNLIGFLPDLTQRLTPDAEPPGGKPCAEGGVTHAHHCRAEIFLDRLIGRLGLYQTLRPLIVGVVHGLAGSAAVTLLVLSTIRSPMWGVAYLLVFGAGTIVGMMLMTTVIAVPFAFTGIHFARTSRYLSLASGLVSAGFGLFMVHHIGFLDGLFTGQIHWSPQ